MSEKGLPPVKITDLRVILTAPDRIRLVVVKVLTSEPGLYGLGCATFTQRALAVAAAIENYLKPLLIGRDVDRIEDFFQALVNKSALNLHITKNSGLASHHIIEAVFKAFGLTLYKASRLTGMDTIPSTKGSI